MPTDSGTLNYKTQGGGPRPGIPMEYLGSPLSGTPSPTTIIVIVVIIIVCEGARVIGADNIKSLAVSTHTTLYYYFFLTRRSLILGHYLCFRRPVVVDRMEWRNGRARRAARNDIQ